MDAMTLALIFMLLALAVLIWCLWALLRPRIKRNQSHTDSLRQGRPQQPMPASIPPAATPPKQTPPSSQLVVAPTVPPPPGLPRSFEPVASKDPSSALEIESSAIIPIADDISSRDSDQIAGEKLDLSANNDWVADYVELEPGLGVVCAKDNSYHDPTFKQAQDWLKRELNLFLIAKDNVDAVSGKECSILLASRLSDLNTNLKVKSAFLCGVPVVLSSDVVGRQARDHVKAYFAANQVKIYQDTRLKFDCNWELVGLRLTAGMRYFLTHSNAGYKLLEREERFLEGLLGPKLETKNSIPKSTEIDMVVVPTLRTNSAKFIQVIKRKSPVLAVRAADLHGASIGDKIPAWKWLSGDFFCYPVKD